MRNYLSIGPIGRKPNYWIGAIIPAWSHVCGSIIGFEGFFIIIIFLVNEGFFFFLRQWEGGNLENLLPHIIRIEPFQQSMESFFFLKLAWSLNKIDVFLFFSKETYTTLVFFCVKEIEVPPHVKYLILV